MIEVLRKLGIKQQLTGISVWVYVALLIASIGFAYLVAYSGFQIGVLSIVLLLGVPALIYMLANLKFGIIALLVFSFFLSRIGNFLVKGFPMGTVIDSFLFLMLIGLLVRKAQRRDFRLANSPVSYVIWIWLILNALQILNPMQFAELWIYAIRSMAGHMIFYFIVIEALDDLAFMKKLIIVWVGLAFLGAAYGLFQEFYGLLPAEKNWVMADPRRYNLYTYHGNFRIFSFFNDPTVYGILMSFTSLFCLLILNVKQMAFKYKVVLAICAGTMLLAVIYTGTRTAYAMIPAGIGVFALITFRKRIILFASLFFFVGAAIIFSDIQHIGPLVSRVTLKRVRSAFSPSEDASYQVRLNNQAIIKPFIRSHPFGAGIGTLGSVGKRFNPGGSLTGFDADSMYVKVAVENGWVGLLVYCSLLAVVMITGIRNYFKMHDPELKIYLAAILAVLYSITVANYTQMVTLQLPNAFIFYALLAFVVKLPEFDKKLLSKQL
jgi:putative inorganic carbon (HCO3(-)) transporter